LTLVDDAIGESSYANAGVFRKAYCVYTIRIDKQRQLDGLFDAGYTPVGGDNNRVAPHLFRIVDMWLH
jgi:hypothetical protein